MSFFGRSWRSAFPWRETNQAAVFTSPIARVASTGAFFARDGLQALGCPEKMFNDINFLQSPHFPHILATGGSFLSDVGARSY